jgi:hypothetical protein
MVPRDLLARITFCQVTAIWLFGLGACHELSEGCWVAPS